VPGFSYDDLDGVADGNEASTVFYRLASDGSLSAGDRTRYRRALLAYCERDTLGHKPIKGIPGPLGRRPSAVYGLLFTAAAETFATITAHPNRLGGPVDHLVLHTWDRLSTATLTVKAPCRALGLDWRPYRIRTGVVATIRGTISLELEPEVRASNDGCGARI
jgi:hypothetical protein